MDVWSVRGTGSNPQSGALQESYGQYGASHDTTYLTLCWRQQVSPALLKAGSSASSRKKGLIQGRAGAESGGRLRGREPGPPPSDVPAAVFRPWPNERHAPGAAGTLVGPALRGTVTLPFSPSAAWRSTLRLPSSWPTWLVPQGSALQSSVAHPWNRTWGRCVMWGIVEVGAG